MEEVRDDIVVDLGSFCSGILYLSLKLSVSAVKNHEFRSFYNSLVDEYSKFLWFKFLRLTYSGHIRFLG